ncbi:MAG: hypothetical protein LC687_06330 [Actinobacteria bacterium]|nr:hypothetical protein [Actinomycetota bacterium]
MKEFPSNSLSYSNRSAGAATKEMLMIRQADIEEGYMTSGGAHRFLWSLLEGGEQSTSSDSTYDCSEGWDDVWIYVYRYDPNLQYVLRLSHGVLYGKTPDEDNTYTQKIKFSSSKEQRLMFPTYGEVDYTWLGNKVYDMNGNPIAPPKITEKDGTVFSDQQVFGTLLYTYSVPRDKYHARIYLREDAGVGAFDSVAYALHKGGPTWAELQAPASLKEYCGGGGGGRTTIDEEEEEEDGPPHADHVDSAKKIDYCTGEVIYDYP